MEGPVPMQSHCPTETLMFSSEATFNIQRSPQKSIFLSNVRPFSIQGRRKSSNRRSFSLGMSVKHVCARSHSIAKQQQISEISDLIEIQQQQHYNFITICLELFLTGVICFFNQEKWLSKKGMNVPKTIT